MFWYCNPYTIYLVIFLSSSSVGEGGVGVGVPMEGTLI